MDANGLVVMPGKGPVWKMAPGRSSTLKLRNGETDESVMIFEEVAPVGTVTPMHLHHDSDEIAYVLSGEITFKIGDAVTVGGPGTCAFMPRDVAHAWKSTGAETGRVLFVNEDTEVTNFGEHLLRRVIDEHFYDLLVRPRVLAGKHVPGIGLNQIYEQATVPQLREIKEALSAVALDAA